MHEFKQIKDYFKLDKINKKEKSLSNINRRKQDFRD